MPPTERKGRVHTSTVTVVVAEIPQEVEWKLSERDITTFTTKDTGPGGQHRNKTESCVIMRHVPTGIEAKAATKSQLQNRKTARELLEARVKYYFERLRQDRIDRHRAGSRGSGMRGDKIRTYRERDDVVTDHRREKKARLRDVKNGHLEVFTF